jgi:hypothetical protein
MKGKTNSVPNPAARQLRPVELITDRAKRYRANASPPPGPRRCAFCQAAKARDIDHIDGDEHHGAARNLQYLCRTCNVRKGITQSRANQGTRTRQYNPFGEAAETAAPTFEQYCDAILILRGDEDAAPAAVRNAARALQNTPPRKRAQYGELIRQARNPKPGSPTFAQYAYAVSVHTRGAHDEGGKIIHATPPQTRSKYAREIASIKRRKGRSQEPVPF